MLVHNTSVLPSKMVESLLWWVREQFEFQEPFNTLGITVKNTRHVYRGRAYPYVPKISHFHEVEGVERLAVVAFGNAEDYPEDNYSIRYGEWNQCKAGTPYHFTRHEWKSQKLWLRYAKNPVSPTWPHYLRILEPRGSGEVWECRMTRQTYGGAASPYIVMADQVEGFITTAAHELNHIRQFHNNWKPIESECEQKAWDVLKAFREERKDSLSAVGKALEEMHLDRQERHLYTSTSEWIRNLSQEGHSTSEIARITGKRYQQVRQALQSVGKR